MTHQQLVSYINGQLSQGVSREAITATLQAKGWQEQDISNAFSLQNAPAPIPPKKNHVLLIVLAILGGIIILGGFLASTVLVSLNSAREKARDAAREADIKRMQIELELYYDSHGTYPASLESSQPQYIDAWPRDPETNMLYDYTLRNPSGYDICAHLETGEQSCVTSDF